MKQFSLSWEVEKEHNGILLREFLKLKELSKRALTDIKFQGGKITVNGEERTVRTILKELDLVQIYFPIEKPSEDLIAEDIPFEIVYEDDTVLVINKPFGIPSIPSREHPKGTLANGLLFYYQSIGLQSTIHIVTRLDKDTSGLMLVAKNRYIHYLFSKNELKNVQRKYLAIVHGHPLIGDDLYGGNTDRLKRQALHSYQLSFVHPIDHTEKNFEIALPADIMRLIDS